MSLSAGFSSLRNLALVLLWGIIHHDNVYAAQPNFCADNYAGLEQAPAKKSKLDKMIEQVKDADNKSILRWPTRWIPYVLDPELKNEAVASEIKESTNLIGAATTIRFVRCEPEAAKNDKVDGFVVVKMRKEGDEICPAMAGACADTGYRPKNKPGSVKEDTQGQSDALATLRTQGTSVIVTPKVDRYKIAHELLHVLGFKHAHQYAGAAAYVSILSNDASNCTAYPTNRMLPPTYDPASIMHYELGTFCQMQLKCEKLGKVVGNSTELKECAVDKVVAERVPCLYADEKIVGSKCFARPAKRFSGSGTPGYGSSDFGQRKCLSMIDQAWVQAWYGAQPKDAFGIGELANSGVCDKVVE